MISGFAFDRSLGSVIVAYLALNVVYSAVLKWVVILDVVSLAFGFVLRVWGGAVVLHLVPSHWLQLSVFFFALLISLAKRRQELQVLVETASKHRKALADYNHVLIDQLIAITTAVAILCYAMYTFSPEVMQRVGSLGLIYTVPFVVYGLFRYLYLIHIRQETLDPTDALLSDRPVFLSVVLWIAAIIYLLYR